MTVESETISTTSTTAMVAGKRKAKNESDEKNHNKNLFALISDVTSTAQSFLSQNDLTLLPSQSLLLDSLISSTSHSLSTLLKPSLSLSLSSPQQQTSWFRRFISSTSISDSRWLDAFRMSNPSFFHLLDLLAPSISSSFPQISPDCALAAAVFRLAHGAGYTSVARRFGISPAEACRAFFTVCKAVNDNLGNLFELRRDSNRVLVGFGFNSLPNCFGVLGLAGFGIEDGKNEFLMVQALVDAEGRFLDVSSGWPNSMKPETILRESKLYHDIQESRELLPGSSYKLSDGSLIPQYILGDSCFPLLPWLLTPYNRVNEEDSFTSAENAFNCAHSHAMGLFGDAFGRLRTRWLLLSESRKWKRDCVEYLPFVIVTACLLHNFLIKCNDPLLREKNVTCVEKEGDFVASEGVVNESAVRIRDALALHLSRVSIKR
ncbi:unnamed protein product [Vicia faba]|uniref:DDE Tnp4 domain-containing protein n=1 Tax=Vicia faba TaxID=3906 RepID=A0AAV1AME7_VICFA|nr:unnamed protein product [Vicia faba]